MNLRSFLLPLTLVAASGAAQAALTLYTDEAAYLSAVGPTLKYIDFNGSPTPAAVVASNHFAANVLFGTCETPVGPCRGEVLHGSDAITDTGSAVSANGVGSLVASVNGLTGTYGVAFHYLSGGIDAIHLNGPKGPASFDTTAASGFIGLVGTDSELVSGFSMIAANAVFPGVGNDRYFFDDFRLNSPIPEPSSFGLLALGLAGVGLASRRRRA